MANIGFISLGCAKNQVDCERMMYRVQEAGHTVCAEVAGCDVVSRCIAKGYGMSRAKQALYEKKVPKEYWEDALADYPDQEDKIMEFLQSRLDEKSDQKDVKKCIDALMRRGHSYGTVRRALNQLQLGREEFQEDF